MVKDKKFLFVAIGLVAAIIIFSIGFVLSKTKSKELISTINKLYFAYSSYIVDLGQSPQSLEDLMQNKNNIAKWNGPYISPTILKSYSEGQIALIHASNIPTKNCSLDYLTYCYNWLKVSNLTSAEFNKIKESINPKAKIFFAENNLFFQLSSVE